MTELKIIDGTPTEISKYLRERKMKTKEELEKEIEELEKERNKLLIETIRIQGKMMSEVLKR